MTQQPTRALGKLRTKTTLKLITPSGGHMDLELKAGTTVDTLIVEMLRLVPATEKEAIARILSRIPAEQTN